MTQIKVVYEGDLRTVCIHENGIRIETDAPKDNHGKGEFFSPTDLLAASLPSCILTYMGIAAKKLALDLKGMTAVVEKEMTSSPKRRIGKLQVCVRCPFEPSSEAREKLEAAAKACAVHASLHPDIQVVIDFIWGL